MSDQNSDNQDAKSGSSQNSGPQRLSEADEPNTMPVDPVAEAMATAEQHKKEKLYLAAEFENYKRQMIKERSDLRKYGAERLVTDLLGVLDIFETALATELTPENAADFRKGIEMTASELRNVLNRHGVSEVPAQGMPFDPSVHEALSSEETDQFPNGAVCRVFKKPYRLHDRVVRPGQVVVAKSKGS